MKILQISSEVNTGSVGRIAEQIGECVIEQGWSSYIAYGREGLESSSVRIKIGNKFDIIKHGFLTRITDRHGFGSRGPTLKLIEKIKQINPDIIHLQHLHGYFINIEILFEFLSLKKLPVVWTFHDCWSFTGHCAYYEFINCDRWLSQCNNCPQKGEYPKSSLLDNSFKNYNDKKRLFNSLSNLTIVPVSNWLGGETKKSFLKNNSIKVIQNGIDLEKFKPNLNGKINQEHKILNKFVILGVASPWNERKGLKYFIELNELIDREKFQIILIGLDKKQIESLPKNMIGLERTENVNQLAEFYSISNVFINPTLEDTFPTTNLEALACGTPVITFKSGGSPEAVDSETGFVVAKGDVKKIHELILVINSKGKEFYSKKCRDRAEMFFDKKKNFLKYIELYKNIVED